MHDANSRGKNVQAFHFIDLPVLRGPIWFAVPAVGNTSNNPWAIHQAIITLTYRGGSDGSVALDQARQLRFMIHFVGDIHQPLHAATLISAQFPNGDAGGNAFPISGVNENELHAYWDSGADQWDDDLVRPLNSTGVAWLNNFTSTIVGLYPASSFGPLLNESDPFQWATESWGVADAFVYTAPQAPTPLPAAYQSQAAQISLQRIALGGYRLAALLESIFNPTPAQAAAREAARSEALRIAADMLARDRAHLRGGKTRWA